MSRLYILDTDHLSLFQRGHAKIIARLTAIPVSQRAVTIISADEQLQGRLAMVRRAKTQTDASREYDRLQETISFFSGVKIIPYDTTAVAHFELLRRQNIRIGTQDLRIASICVTQQAILATRNARDFGQVPDLIIEDWTS